MPIDLNADLGESFGIFTVGDDDGLMPSITSANLAAGFHGGDPTVIRRTVRLAAAHGVSIGVHPSFPDLVGFGRREMRLTRWEVEDAVLYQIASVSGIATAEHAVLRHVKPHGALYNLAARDAEVAEPIAGAVAAFNRALRLYAPPGSALAQAGRSAGLTVIHEGFADRRYTARGELRSRQLPGAVLDDGEAVQQAVRLATAGTLVADDGTIIALRVDSLCVHGDAPGSARRAAGIRAALEAAGVSVEAPGPAGAPGAPGSPGAS